MRLAGKVALITGGASGLGEAFVKKYLEEGASVVFTDINTEAGNKLASELGDNVLFIEQDVTKENDWPIVVNKAIQKFGDIHILVNNAANVIKSSIENLTTDDYRIMIETNQMAPFMGIKYCLESIKRAGNGSIINISSMDGINAGSIGYTDTKFAIRGMSKSAAMELAPLGIRVNSVHPGLVETPKLMESEVAKQLPHIIPFIPLQRLASPGEIANLLVYLASDESSYCTGSEFIVDGGMIAR